MKRAAIINEARLPIRCCPEERHGKSSGSSNLYLSVSQRHINIYMNPYPVYPQDDGYDRFRNPYSPV